MTTKDMRACPKGEDTFDCTSFCDICEGEGEYEYTETRPCVYCQAPVDHDTWLEEQEMCLDCSNKYYDHEEN